MEDPVPAELQKVPRHPPAHDDADRGGGGSNSIYDCHQLTEQLIDFIRTTVVHGGGISALRKIAALAEPYTSTGCHGATDLSPVCMAAALHFGLSVHNFGIQEHMPHTAETDRVFPHQYTYQDGFMHPGEGPGSASRSTRRWPRSILTTRRICPNQVGRDAAQLVARCQFRASATGRGRWTHQTRRTHRRGPRGSFGPLAAREAAAQQMPGALPIRKPSKKRINQSVCQWCYRGMALPDFFKGVVERGLTAVDLLNEEQWTQAKEFGLACSMAYVGAGGINEGSTTRSTTRR